MGETSVRFGGVGKLFGDVFGADSSLGWLL